jgi:hypothetical protein
MASESKGKKVGAWLGLLGTVVLAVVAANFITDLTKKMLHKKGASTPVVPAK